MGKQKKEHRKKVAKRNEAIKTQQKKIQKAKDEFIKQIIEKEKQAGKFNNNPTVASPYTPGVDGPLVNFGEGPTI